MKELVSFLTCLYILNIVSATPYGYRGVHGGAGAAAAAKADANAGAFGGVGAVPLSIPSGGSLTGSYSKSSSSSFAASSASSSSSSFSLSGSGEGSYGHHGLNGIPGSTSCATGNCQSGCTSGNCQPSGKTDSQTANGAANAGAFSNANAGAGSKPTAKNDKQYACNGDNCDGNPKDFNCKDGQCSSSNSDLNDIQVKGIGASNYNVPYNKPLTYFAPPNDGPCTSSQCGFGNGNLYDTAKPSSYNVPIHSSYGNPSLESNEKPCSSGNCGGNPLSDSTYTHNTTPEQSSCPSGNCGTNSNSGSSYAHSTGSPKDKECTSGNCGSFPASQQNGYSSIPSQPAITFPYGASDVEGFPKSPQPSYSSFAQPTSSHSVQSNTGIFVGTNAAGQTSSVGSSPEKVPYKGGFGGPPGLLKPNDFSISVSLNTKPSSPSATPCSYGNCESKPQYQFPNKVNEPASVGGPTGSYYPSSCASGKCVNPATPPHNSPGISTGTYVHTSGFGGPEGTLKPNDNASPSVLSSNYNPTPIHKPSTGSYSPATNMPNTSGNYYSAAEPTQVISQYKPTVKPQNSPPCTSVSCKPTSPQPLFPSSFSEPSSPSCPSGNCGPFPAQPQASHNAEACKTGKCGTPTSQVSPFPTLFSGNSPSNHAPCSNGNCGFSSSNPSYPQSSSQTNSYNPIACTSGNCATGQNPLFNIGAYAGAAAGASSNAVVYSGGFGGPPGLLKPFDDGKLPSAIKSNNYNSGVPATGSYSTYGKSININAAPGTAENSQALAAAGSPAGAFGGSYQSGYNKSGGGCSGGCGGQNDSGLSGGLSVGSRAAAKSAAVAGAGAGAGSYGQSGSFASSSASAYASAGTSVKGGYGRR